jgi:hypothetical protein
MHYVGEQYEWLARYADERGLMNLEMGPERGSNFYNVFGRYISENQMRIEYEELSIFKYFSFPLIDLSKKEMEQASFDRGFYNIMKLTWFCHTPIRNKWPCGVCSPCHSVIEGGLSNHIGWRGLLAHRVEALRQRIRVGTPHSSQRGGGAFTVKTR